MRTIPAAFLANRTQALVVLSHARLPCSGDNAKADHYDRYNGTEYFRPHYRFDFNGTTGEFFERKYTILNYDTSGTRYEQMMEAPPPCPFHPPFTIDVRGWRGVACDAPGGGCRGTNSSTATKVGSLSRKR